MFFTNLNQGCPMSEELFFNRKDAKSAEKVMQLGKNLSPNLLFSSVFALLIVKFLKSHRDFR
jgi:hypothetical protein